MNADLGEYLYKHKENREGLFNITQKVSEVLYGIVMVNEEEDGIEVTYTGKYPNQTYDDKFCITIRFLEEDFETILKRVRGVDGLSFMMTGLCKSYTSNYQSEKYRPIVAILV